MLRIRIGIKPDSDTDLYPDRINLQLLALNPVPDLWKIKYKPATLAFCIIIILESKKSTHFTAEINTKIIAETNTNDRET